MIKTKVQIPGIELDFPVYNGSGSFEYGDYQWTKIKFADIPVLTLKTSELKSKITPEKRINLMQTKGKQVFNSIGLQNPPIAGVIAKIKKLAATLKMPMIASASETTVARFAENVKILAAQKAIVAVELNLSCPNVDAGGITFGTNEDMVKKVVAAARAVTSKPLYVKLSPNVTNIVNIAKAAEAGGADAIVAINTLLGFVCDPLTGKPVIARGYGGYSGPGIFPIALRAVHQIYQAVKIPIIGVGGISCAQDVIDMLSAGARAVQIVSATKNNPNIFQDIKKELRQKMQQMNLNDINQLIGRSHHFKLVDLFPGSYTNSQGVN